LTYFVTIYLIYYHSGLYMTLIVCYEAWNTFSTVSITLTWSNTRHCNFFRHKKKKCKFPERRILDEGQYFHVTEGVYSIKLFILNYRIVQFLLYDFESNS